MPKKIPAPTRATFVSPGDYRSGRGGGVQGGPIWNDKDALGDLPKPTPRTGQSGDPSAAFSVTASQLQQQGYAEDEIEYWKEASFDPPYLVHGDDMGQGKHHVRENLLYRVLRRLVRECGGDILGEYEEEEDASDVEEISSLGGGAIRGHMGGDEDERDRVSEKSFGGGKIE